MPARVDLLLLLLDSTQAQLIRKQIQILKKLAKLSLMLIDFTPCPPYLELYIIRFLAFTLPLINGLLRFGELASIIALLNGFHDPLVQLQFNDEGRESLTGKEVQACVLRRKLLDVDD
ncbi:hypothetical protein Y032_0003g1475 [Ancylostoma ceylanicum]|nr:hypothetical protein Y032_0003g1475 [Ancylostoma ceylanicum]